MMDSISSPVEMGKCGFTLAKCIIADCSSAELTKLSNDEVIESLKDADLMIENADNGIIEIIKEVS